MNKCSHVIKYANFVLLFFIIIAISLLHCSNNPLGGGVSEETNSYILGTVIYSNGVPASNTQVMLIPEHYNPLADSAIPDSLIDTTNAKGNFQLLISKNGTYNILAKQLRYRYSFFMTDVVVDNDTQCIANILQPSGALRILLPDSCDTNNGYVYVEGTPFYKKVTNVIDSMTGKYFLFLDNIPADTFPRLSYSEKIPNPKEIVLAELLPILSNDTITIEAYTEWTTFTTKNSPLPNNFIHEIAIDADNTKWICTRGGVAALKDSTWEIYNRANSSLPHDTVYFLSIAPDNSKWFGTYSGVAQLNDTGWTIYNKDNSPLPSDTVLTTAVQNDSTIWFGTISGGVARKIDTNWTIYNTKNSKLPTNRIQTIVFDNDNNVWFGTYLYGVAKFDGANWTIYNTSNSNIAGNDAQIALKDRSGNIWVGISGVGGLSVFDGTKWTTVNSGNSDIPNGLIFTMLEDKQGHIWVGMYNGQQNGIVAGFDGSQWVAYDQSNSEMINDRVYGLACDQDKTFWVGTRSGLVSFGPKQNPIDFKNH